MTMKIDTDISTNIIDARRKLLSEKCNCKHPRKLWIWKILIRAPFNIFVGRTYGNRIIKQTNHSISTVNNIALFRTAESSEKINVYCSATISLVVHWSVEIPAQP